MKVLDPGHAYELAHLDAAKHDRSSTLRFVKREGAGFPGNVGAYPGTNCQEVLRALIDRVEYLDGQIRAPENEVILNCLRMALWAFEVRAMRRHGVDAEIPVAGIEKAAACEECGHLRCVHMPAQEALP